MQFTIALVAAHACVASHLVHRTLDRLAGLPDPQKPVQAVALAGVVSLVSGYLNWAFCIVACALFVPFLCKRNPRADVRLLVAASLMGLGTVWHGGFSGSAPLILATPGNPLLEPGSGPAVVERLYPVTETLFNPFNLVYMIAIGAVGLVASMALHPRRDVRTLTPSEVERILPKPPEAGRARADTGRPHRCVPRLGVARCDPACIPARSLDRDARLRTELDHQLLQRGVSGARARAPRAAAVVPARVSRRRRCRMGDHPSVPVLRGHLRTHAEHCARRVARWALCRACYPAHVPSHRVRVLGVHEPFRSRLRAPSG